MLTVYHFDDFIIGTIKNHFTLITAENICFLIQVLSMLNEAIKSPKIAQINLHMLQLVSLSHNNLVYKKNINSRKYFSHFK